MGDSESENKPKYEYPILKTPPPPKVLIIDGDSILFKAASAGEQVWYVAKTPDGEEVARFESASSYDSWIQSCDIMGFDDVSGYTGDVSELIREVEYEYRDVNNCYKAFDKTVEEWLTLSGCDEWIMWIGKATGLKNFRYDIATIHPYKHGRDKMRKPHYLEQVRKYASKKPQVKVVKGSIEVDDRVVAEAEKRKHKCVLAFVDKDNTQCRGCYQLFIGYSNTPYFVTMRSVGEIKMDGSKVWATSYLRVASQLIHGDKAVDGIVGLPGYGPKKAYNLLKEFDGVSVKHAPEVFQRVAKEYEKVYGYSHTYHHCTTGEEITRDWIDMFEENLRLLWMKRHKDDTGEEIMRWVR